MGNMFSAVCASSIYSRLCMKMSAFLSVCTWAIHHIYHVEFHFRFRHLVSFPVISGGVAVKVRSHQEKFDVNVYREGGKKNLEGRANFQGTHHF